jgi:hypothetical protein
MNENFIANVKLYTTMPTSEEFYVHYTWTYSSAGHPSKDLYHVWGGSWIENGSIICEERIFDIDHAGGQSGTKVYIQPKLDLNNVYPKWDFQNLSFSYTVNGNPFYCKNIMWGNDHSWVETPRIL